MTRPSYCLLPDSLEPKASTHTLPAELLVRRDLDRACDVACSAPPLAAVHSARIPAHV